jgi:hypothetical protein
VPTRPSVAEAARRRRLLRVLVAGTVVVLTLDVVMRSIDRVAGTDVAHWFDVGREHNIPTAWSVLLLLTGAVACARRAKRDEAGAAGWWMAAVAATYLAADEWFGWHEHLKSLGNRLADVGVGLATYAWVVPGAVLLAAGTVMAFRWSHRLPPDTGRMLRLAVVVYGTGVLGVEAISGWVHAERSWWAWTVLTLLEEGLEMAGAVLFVAAVTRDEPSQSAGGLEAEVSVRHV